MLTCLVGSIQSFVVGICLNHDRATWTLKWDLQLLIVVYSGVLNTGVAFVLISWAISRRGPIYPPMFNSLSLIVATVLDSLLLGTNIYVGSVLGTLLIVVGLYAFLWGKDKETKIPASAATAQVKQELQGDDLFRIYLDFDMAEFGLVYGPRSTGILRRKYTVVYEFGLVTESSTLHKVHLELSLSISPLAFIVRSSSSPM
ncbi:hypothetical protein EJB05_36495, partial [Eragrostis curvula]